MTKRKAPQDDRIKQEEAGEFIAKVIDTDPHPSKKEIAEFKLIQILHTGEEYPSAYYCDKCMKVLKELTISKTREGIFEDINQATRKKPPQDILDVMEKWRKNVGQG
jgi:hypothetical protein